MIIKPIQEPPDKLRHEFHDVMIKSGYRHEQGMIYKISGVRITLCEPFVFDSKRFVEINIAGKMFKEDACVTIDVRDTEFESVIRVLTVALNTSGALKFTVDREK